MSDNVILAANAVGKYTAEQRWLIFRNGSGDVEISTQSIPPTKLEVGDVIDLGESTDAKTVRVKNLTSDENVIEFQNSPRQIITNNTKQVKIVGGFLNTIIEPFEVTASATVENGTVTNLSHNTLEDVADITIPAGNTVTVLAADGAAKKRTVIVQNISATETTLRVGGATVANGRGCIIKGSIDAIASFEQDVLGVVKVHNESASSAKVSVSWGVR